MPASTKIAAALRTRLKKRYLALPVAALIGTCMFTPSPPDSVGERWYLQEEARLPEAGFAESNLFRGTRYRNVKVDDEVSLHVFYPPDCIAYVRIPATGVRVICGDRIGITVPFESPSSVHLDWDGLRYWEHVTDSTGKRVADREYLVPRDSVLAAARRQPERTARLWSWPDVALTPILRSEKRRDP